MRHRRIPRTILVAFGLPIVLVVAGPAEAEDAAKEAVPIRRSAEILAHMDEELESKPSAFTRFGLNTRHGLTYRHSLKLGGRRFDCRISGPVQRRTTFGLRFKVEF